MGKSTPPPEITTPIIPDSSGDKAAKNGSQGAGVTRFGYRPAQRLPMRQPGALGHLQQCG
ncbi:hypothetical protein [Streptomyces sp. NBC_00624]|uniref:hypothetical protein n=1 Tax=Streptomyces sp. NBC_00624 TaxID=2975791 RepID=UPI0030DE24A5